MFKKTLLSLAIASTFSLTGCLDDGGQTNENTNIQNNTSNPQTDGRVYPVFNPAQSALPIPNDLIFDATAGDGTFAVPDSVPPVTTALNALSGASTTSPIDIEFSGEIDASSIDANPFMLDSNGQPVLSSGVPVPNPNQNVFLIELDYASGDPVQGLTAQEPPTIPLAANFLTIGTLAAKAATTALTVEEATALNNAVVAVSSEAQSPDYTASVYESGGKSFLRIHPKNPLKPRARYVVAITNEVKDAMGNSIVASSAYSQLTLTDAESPIPSPRLTSVRALINNLWEKIATTYFALNNGARTTPLTAENIALSYSFTTSGDEKVLEYIANPAEWFNDQLTTFVRISAAKSIVTGQTDLDGDSDTDYNDVKIAADGAIASFPSDAIKPVLSPLEAAFPLFGCSGVSSGPSYISCIGAALAGLPSGNGGFADILPTPKARNITTTSANQPVSLISAPVASLISPALSNTPPLVAQGTMEIPYYLGIPTGNTAAEGAVINTQSWQADSTLAGEINKTFANLGLALPQGVEQGDSFKSTHVNYIFPFPKQTDADAAANGTNDLTIPWIAVYPHPATAATITPKGTVIFQHGITTDRSAVLSVGTVLAQQGFTVIGIDQVAHGIAPASTAKKLGLAATLLQAGQDGGLPANLAPGDTNNQAVVDGTLNLGFVMGATGADAATAQGTINAVLSGGTTGNADLDTAIKTLASFEAAVANAGSTIPGLAPTANERHFNFTADASLSPTPMSFDADTAFGSSGSLFINLTGFTNSRDKNRQGVIDLLNLRESLVNIDLNNDGTTGDLDTTNVYFSGHSLGTVIGIPFVAVANSTPVGNIQAASFLEPASGIVRMLENSPSFGPTIIGGLAANGVAQGTSNFESFMSVFQAALDSVDPINFADNLGRKVPSSDMFQTNADLEGNLVILNAGTADVNGATVHKADQTNIIEAVTTQLGDAQASYYAGVEQFAAQMGVSDVIGASLDGTPDNLRARLAFGKHGMFVLPTITTAETAALGETEAAAELNRRKAAFAEGLTQTATFFGTNGEMQGVSDTTGLTNVTGILIEEDDFNGRPNKQLN